MASHRQARDATRSPGRSDRPRLGISACLLGEKVRYDGGHKLDIYLRDTLGQFVTWVPVCPEVECGLPVPREAMRLVGDPQAPRLFTRSGKTDHTERMLSWASKRLDALEKEQLCGFVFKSRSPSSGMRDVKIYHESGMPGAKGRGLFAGEFMKRFPLLPVEDEGRLNDGLIRENFIERIFVYRHWQDMAEQQKSVSRLVEFHTVHKLIIMSHSAEKLRDLGKIAASADRKAIEEFYRSYFEILTDALSTKTSVKKHVNVLMHIMGYFKKVLSPDEKQELLEVIGSYHREQVPLIVPVTLLNHYVRKYQEPYLGRQVYLNPHPLELMLRNHV